MSGRRITELTAATSVDEADLLVVVDMTGTPTTKRVQAGTLIGDIEALVTVNVRTDDYTLTAGDAGNAVEMDVGVANTVTVPPESAVNFPVGTVIEIAQAGVGQTTVVEGLGVDVHTAQTLVLRGQWSAVSLRKRDADDWLLVGDVEEAP